MKDVFDASISWDIAATLETDIHSSGQAICNLPAAQGGASACEVQTSSDL